MTRPKYTELLERIREEEQEDYGDGLCAPADDQAIRSLADRAKERLGAGVPAPYLDFLRVVNGLDFGGILLYAAGRTPVPGLDDGFIEDLVQANEDIRETGDFDGFIMLGESSRVYYGYLVAEDRYVSLTDMEQYEEEAEDFDELMCMLLRLAL